MWKFIGAALPALRKSCQSLHFYFDQPILLGAKLLMIFFFICLFSILVIFKHWDAAFEISYLSVPVLYHFFVPYIQPNPPPSYTSLTIQPFQQKISLPSLWYIQLHYVPFLPDSPIYLLKNVKLAHSFLYSSQNHPTNQKNLIPAPSVHWVSNLLPNQETPLPAIFLNALLTSIHKKTSSSCQLPHRQIFSRFLFFLALAILLPISPAGKA